jgi:nuclear transcription Y subunit beta
VSEFVSFITSEASDRCHQEKRKTINGEDILFAMSSLGFDNYVEPLKLYLQKYREANKGDKSLGLGENSSSSSGFLAEVIGEGGTDAGAGEASAGTLVFTYDLNSVHQQGSSGQTDYTE